MHEAFAEPTDARPEPDPVIPKQPPNPVEEMPPDQKPEGDNVQWISGYWSWDDGQSDFVWISGLWRILPPGRQWVPGNWQPVEGGFQWTPGFWSPMEQTSVEYLPAPPPPLEAVSGIPQPDATSSYVPGVWVYQQTRYLWRPGFWIGYRPGWVWTPAHYVWTPAGYLFVDGYWDHPLCERGLLFAPVRFRSPYHERRLVYTPEYVIQPDFMMTALFVRPRYHHYYFGDYFEERYSQRGFVPWVDYRQSRVSVDPNFAYYHHMYGHDPRWEQNLRSVYVGRRDGSIERPPQTLVQQTTVINNINVNKTTNTFVTKNINITHEQNVQVLTPLKQFHNTQTSALASLSSVKPPPSAVQVVKLQAVSAPERAAGEKPCCRGSKGCSAAPTERGEGVGHGGPADPSD